MSRLCLIREKSTKFGGAEVYLERLSNALQDNHIDHKVLHSLFPKFLPSWLRIILFNLQVCLFKKDKFYFSLERIVCPDIYRAGDGVHKVFLSTEKKSKLNPLHPIYLSLEKRCFNNAKRIIANSHMIKNEIIQTYDINANKIDVVYNGVESKEINYAQSYQKLSQEFNLACDMSIILYVGSGFKRKGVEEFLQIISKLDVKDYRAFIVGKEKKMAYYQQLAQDLGIDNKVVFTGPRADVEDFYTISDIFLFPTRYEPFSNVVLEAMSFKNAVFTTRQNGAHEILENEYIMNNSQDFSVVKKIDQLLANANDLNDIKDSNKSKADHFSIELNMKDTMNVIKGLRQ